MKNARTPQEAAAEALAAILTAAYVPAEHIGAGIVDTWIDVRRDGHDGAARLHVHENAALVTLAITFYDPADDDQPGRPVADEEHATVPVADVDNILTALAHLMNEHD